MKINQSISHSLMTLVKKLHSFFTSIAETIKQIKKKKEKENTFLLRNGGILLEELIATSNGLHNPIRLFSVEELLTATNNFQSPYSGMVSQWYKGTLDGRPILVCKDYNMKHCVRKWIYRDIAISIKMSSHSNVLKLLGCCLEFSNPILVFEDAKFGLFEQWLDIHSSESCSFPWKKRLKAAKDIAHAVTFLHTAFDRPIVHRDINPGNILLDKDHNAKLTGFSFSITIPEGETIAEVNQISGTLGYLDPESMCTGYVSEQSDVYSFGVFMIELFIGKSIRFMNLSFKEKINEPDVITQEDESEMKVDYICSIRYFLNHKLLHEVVDREILEEEGGISQKQRSQFQAFIQLALRCTEYKSGDRPLMIDVAKELRQIERSTMVAQQPRQCGT